MTWKAKIATVAVVTFVALAPGGRYALAQDKSLAQRLQQLEEQVADLNAQLESLKVAVANDKLMAQLDGIWIQRSHIQHGKPVTETDDVIWQLKPHNAYQWILSPEPPMWTLGSMDVDASQTPPWVNFRRDRHGDGSRVIPGIIKIENGRVYLALREKAACVPTPDNCYEQRPTSFESSKDNGVSLFVLERQAPQ